MPPHNILFQTVSNLTGGLVTDITTAMIAIITIGFICLGLDYLKDSFEMSFQGRMGEKYSKGAKDALAGRDLFSKGSYEWEEQNAIARRLSRKAVDLKIKSRGY